MHEYDFKSKREGGIMYELRFAVITDTKSEEGLQFETYGFHSTYEEAFDSMLDMYNLHQKQEDKQEGVYYIYSERGKSTRYISRNGTLRIEQPMVILDESAY